MEMKVQATSDPFSESRVLFERAKRSLAGGVTSQFRAFNVPRPMSYEGAAGSRAWDVDGNELIDSTLSHGSCNDGEPLGGIGVSAPKSRMAAALHEEIKVAHLTTNAEDKARTSP